MQSRAVLAAVLNSLVKGRVLVKVAVANRFGNAGKLLVNNAAGTNVGVPNLTVSHLPVRQSNIHAGGANFGGRAGGKNTV